MKKTALTTITIITMTALLLIYTPAAAQNDEGGGFSETFDDSTLEGWEISEGATVSGGVLKISPGNFAFRHGTWSELTLTVQLKFTPPGEVMIHYYASETGSYNLHIMKDVLFLEKVENGSPSGLAESQASIQSGNWMDLEIAFTGGQHQITLDNVLILDVNDPQPLNPGTIGFVMNGENDLEIDNLIVSAQESEPVPVSSEMGAEPAPPEGEGPPPLEGGQPAQPVGMTAATSVSATPAAASSLIEELFTQQANPLELQTFLLNLVLSAMLSFILSLVYIHWGASLSNRRKFAANFMLMTITTTFIILVVRSSVALSLGLVGALSIVRFRTAVKEPEELAYLFLAIGLGIGLGDNQRLVTILAFAVSIIILGLMKVFRRSQADVNLHLNLASYPPEKLDPDQVMDALKTHCSKIKLLRFDENDKVLEMSFLIEFKKVSNLNAARETIHQLSGSVDITFLDNKGIW
ncbi:MAG: DUF4956 domain-containing protein [Anaerolineaceae bacterium]|nr:DUF4956 domain-containing protein [Anaerolineaceae bacterium]